MPGLALRADTRLFAPRWGDALDDAVSDLAWREDGGLVAASAGGHVSRYAGSGRREAGWQAHGGGVIRLAARPGGPLLATAGEDGEAKVWSAAGELRAVAAQTGSWMDQLEWSADGRVLAAAAARTVYLWHDGGAAERWRDPGPGVLAMAWAPDGERLATASNRGVYVRRLDGDAPARLLEFPGAPVSVAWSRSGTALAAGTQDGLLQIWRRDRAGKARQQTMRGYLAKVSCLAWHPRRPLIASAGGKDVVLWKLADAKAGNRPAPLRRHARTVTRLAYAADGSWLASADRAGRVCVWRESGELAAEWFMGSEVTALQWCGDRPALAVGTSDGTLSLHA